MANRVRGTFDGRRQREPYSCCLRISPDDLPCGYNRRQTTCATLVRSRVAPCAVIDFSVVCAVVGEMIILVGTAAGCESSC